jgi:hypothetical protein
VSLAWQWWWWNCGRCFVAGFVGQPCPFCDGPERPICAHVYSTKDSPSTFVLPCELSRLMNKNVSTNEYMLSNMYHLTQNEVTNLAVHTFPLELETEHVINTMPKGSWKCLMSNITKNTFSTQLSDVQHEPNQGTRDVSQNGGGCRVQRSTAWPSFTHDRLASTGVPVPTNPSSGEPKSHENSTGLDDTGQ